MKLCLLLAFVLVACGTDDNAPQPSEPACWYENGDNTLHKYYPQNYKHNDEFEQACEKLGKLVVD